MIRALRATKPYRSIVVAISSCGPTYIRRAIPQVICRFAGTSIDGIGDASIQRSQWRKPSKWNIEAMCPELIKYWHSSKNINVKPDELSIKSAGKIWWRCGKGPDHEWKASPRCMHELYTNEEEVCPFCSNRKVSVTNSLATLYPEISSQWDTSKNGELTPSKVLPTSSLSVWWKCDKGEHHEWKRVIHRRTHPRSSIEDKCPFCCGVDIQSNSLAVCRPDLAAEWDYSRNGDLTPETVSKSSSKRVWWVCPNGHHYQSAVYNRGSTHNTQCPVCSGRQVTDSTKLSGNLHLMEFLDKERNPGIDANKTSVLSRKQLFWRCPESLYDERKQNHKWKCSIHDMITLYNYECPFCSNLLFVKVVGEENSRKDNGNAVQWSNYPSDSEPMHPSGYKKTDKSSSSRKWVKEREGRIRRRTLDDLDFILESLGDETISHV